MIRSLRATDLPDLLALLHWMDDAPEREVFAPDARDVRELHLECEDNVCLVDQGEDGGVRAYCALSPFRDGLVLEGPIGDVQLGALLTHAARHTEGLPVYAFCARDNQPVRDALEAAGFTPMHSTAFYAAPLAQLGAGAALPPDCRVASALPFPEYRALYRAAEDAWAGRLDWTPEQYDAHFAGDDVRLVALLRGDRPLAFAELEFSPEHARADVTHLAVHPAERGQGLGRALLALAAEEARTHPELNTLRVRAHDHMRPARALYARAGFTHCRSIVTYLRDGDEEA